MKRIIALALCAAAITTTSCKDPQINDIYLNQNVAVILRSPQDTVGLQIAKGVLGAGYEYGVYPTIFSGDSLTDYQSQIEILNNLDPAAFIGVIIVPASQTELNVAIAAVNPIIPVVVAEMQILATTPVLAYVGTDELTAGQELADQIHKEISATQTVSIIQVGDNFNISARYDGVAERLAGFGNNVVSNKYESHNDLAYYITALITESHTEIRAIITCDPKSAAIAAEVIQNNGRSEIKVYTFGLSSSVVTMIASGEISGSMVSNTYDIGFQSVTSIVDNFNQGIPQRTQYQKTMYINSANISSNAAAHYINPI